VVITDPDSEVYLSLGYQPLPDGVPATALAGMVELGVKAMVPGYKKLREETGERPGYKFQDSWFTVTVDGAELNGVLRFVGRGSQAFYIIAMGKVEPWEKLRPAALSVLDTFTLFEPKSATP